VPVCFVFIGKLDSNKLAFKSGFYLITASPGEINHYPFFVAAFNWQSTFILFCLKHLVVGAAKKTAIRSMGRRSQKEI